MGDDCRSVDANGVEVRVRVSVPAAAGGTRNPQTLVFVHGIGMSHRAFGRLESALRDSYRLVTVDLPGFGGAKSPGRRLAIAGLADAVDAALERLGVDEYSVVGQSMGTEVAVELAGTRPARVRAVVLLGPVTDDRRPGLGRHVAALLRDTLVESPRMNAIVVSDYLRSIPQYLRELGPMLAYPTRTRVAKLTTPVLVVRGRRDGVARHDWAARLADAAEHGRLVEPTGPHHVQEHSGAVVAAAIDEFIGRVREPRA